MKTCSIEGCDRPMWSWSFCVLHGKRFYRHGDPFIVKRPGRPPDLPPTPHDQLTYDGWNRNAQPLPPLELIHNGYRETYQEQNERDGYLTDPEYLAAVAAWTSEPLEMAAG